MQNTAAIYSSLSIFSDALCSLLKDKAGIKCINLNRELNRDSGTARVSFLIMHFCTVEDYLLKKKHIKIESDYKIFIFRRATEKIIQEIYNQKSSIAFSESVSAEDLINVIKTVVKSENLDFKDIKKNLPFVSRKIIAPQMLSPREVEILNLLAQGMTAYSISLALGISVFTARNHVAKIYEKLAVNDRVGAVIKAISLGILRDLPDLIEKDDV